jgi:hypothetical protein
VTFLLTASVLSSLTNAPTLFRDRSAEIAEQVGIDPIVTIIVDVVDVSGLQRRKIELGCGLQTDFFGETISETRQTACGRAFHGWTGPV